VYSGYGFLRKHMPKSPTANPADWIKFTYWGSIIDTNLNPYEEIFFYNGFGTGSTSDTVEVFHDTDGGTDTRFWMFHDYLGSTRQIVTNDTNPTTDKRIDYTAFGTVDSESGNNYSKSPYRYAGNWGYYDGSGRSATTTADSLILSGYRWYDPSIGRRLTEDPIRFWGGWNRYAYCANGPATFVDQLGLTVVEAMLQGLVEPELRANPIPCPEPPGHPNPPLAGRSPSDGLGWIGRDIGGEAGVGAIEQIWYWLEPAPWTPAPVITIPLAMVCDCELYICAKGAVEFGQAYKGYIEWVIERGDLGWPNQVALR
jgi:RHS repeat-associated protein